MIFRIALFVACIACVIVWLTKCLPAEFSELDLASKVVTLVFQRILPLLKDCETSFSSLESKRRFLNILSQTSNSLDELFHPELMLAKILDIDIPTDGGKYKMKARLYWDSREENLDNLRPVMVWFHGGGWLSGDINQDDTICRRFALMNNFVVANIEYRLSPENVYPAATDDAYAALRWVGEHIARYGGDINRVILAGESSGGHLAAALAVKYFESNLGDLKVTLKSLLLVYPPLDYTSTTYQPLSNVTAMLPLGHIEFMRRTFIGYNNDGNSLINDYIFAPMNAPNHILKQFPPTVLILAKHDVLAAEGIRFGEKLKNLGVEVVSSMYNSSIHIFFGRWPFQHGLSALQEASRCLSNFLN